MSALSELTDEQIEAKFVRQMQADALEATTIDELAAVAKVILHVSQG